jgi:hypothetical protein
LKRKKKFGKTVDPGTFLRREADKFKESGRIP